jgi:type II secretory pathway pseudopilin PulG
MKIRVYDRAQRLHAWSLAEVMIAVAMLAILLVSLFTGMAYGFGVVKATREDLRATQILTQKIEGIRLCTWAQLTNGIPSSFTETYQTTSGSNSPSVIYNGTITLSSNTNLPSGYRDKVKLVTVTVTWQTSRGFQQTPLAHSRSMQTQSAYYGLQNYLYGLTNSI